MIARPRLPPAKDNTEELQAQWREMAAKIAKVHPDWSKVEIAKKVQESPLGRKNGTSLTYSVSFIVKSIGPMKSTQEQYEHLLSNALEDVFVIAARRGIDTRQLAAAFDAERGPGLHQEHTLTISVRDTPLVVTAYGIPHTWLSIDTGYIDSRFSQQIAVLLSDLERKAQRDGPLI
ncbi:MAG: hypothetical protein HY067_04800 [Betaproteobacteria bacterium]|nr:hypothetical protein [Betaproteobacteria bacterium]